MNTLRFLVVEYWPHVMDNDKLRPARIDGHYQSRALAEEIAALWAENPKGKESRIVVVEIVHEEKSPAHWIEEAAK